MARNTCDDLLSSVRLRAFSPSSQVTFSDDDILLMATEELNNGLIPTVRQAFSHFLEATLVFDLTSATVNGFQIPDRAVGSVLAKAFWADSTGVQNEVRVVDRTYASNATYPYAWTSGSGDAYVSDNKLYLGVFPPVQATTLTFIYYLRPGDLVKTSACRTVISKTDTSVTLSSALPGLSTGVTFDVIGKASPYSYKSTDISGTVAGAVISGLTDTSSFSSGDWVALAGQSPIPQIPYDFHTALRARTTARLLEALGDRSGMAAVMASAEELEAKLLASIKPRLSDQPNMIITSFPLRGQFSGGRRWGR